MDDGRREHDITKPVEEMTERERIVAGFQQIIRDAYVAKDLKVGLMTPEQRSELLAGATADLRKTLSFLFKSGLNDDVFNGYLACLYAIRSLAIQSAKAGMGEEANHLTATFTSLASTVLTVAEEDGLVGPLD